MWRCTFSMTTMASSTTRPVASVMPNKRERVDGEAEDLDEREGADQRNRNGDGGNDGGAPVEQEQEDDDDDDDDGFAQRDQDFADGVADHGGGVEGDGVFKPGREALRKLFQSRLRLGVHVERVGVGKLLHADAHGARVPLYFRLEL